MANGLSQTYHLNESIFSLRDFRSKISFSFDFSMKFLSANRIVPDETPHFAVSNLGQFCLQMFHKKDTRPIPVNRT